MESPLDQSTAARIFRMTEATTTSWRDLYLAALFSLDDSEIPAKIEAAEKAIRARAHELFELRTDSIEEGAALHDATYALAALRGCVALRTTAAPAAAPMMLDRVGPQE